MLNFRLPEAPSAGIAQLYLREEQMRQAYEAMLMAWRLLNGACDPVLRAAGLGAAHHRIMFLVASHEGITPGGLLTHLGVTKQSLGRALNELKERGLIEQTLDECDRRLKPLRLTPAGAQIEQQLFRQIRDVMTRAYREAGVSAVEGFRRVFTLMQDAPERAME